MKCPLCSLHEASLWCELSHPVRRYLQCASCKLVWLEEGLRLNVADEEARYRTHENDPAAPEYMAYLSRTALPVVDKLSPGAHGLDFGCGPTTGMEALLSARGFRVCSYDPIFFPHDELLNNRYDFALCCEAAEHFYSPALEFDRLARLVKPGGWLAVSSCLVVPREKFAQWWYRRDPTHVCFYSAETVEWIAGRWGWRVEELKDPLWLLQRLPGR
jgi:SAM-dependent methyltransferase